MEAPRSDGGVATWLAPHGRLRSALIQCRDDGKELRRPSARSSESPRVARPRGQLRPARHAPGASPQNPRPLLRSRRLPRSRSFGSDGPWGRHQRGVGGRGRTAALPTPCCMRVTTPSRQVGGRPPGSGCLALVSRHQLCLASVSTGSSGARQRLRPRTSPHDTDQDDAPQLERPAVWQ
jgi:hypothetical protein